MVEGFETQVLQRLTAIETKLDDYKGIREKAEKAYSLSADNKEEIDKIKDNNKWLFRTTVGAVITGLIGIGISIFNK